MGSSGKRKTTMAKLNRERKLQERRRDKAARKDARRSAPASWDTEVPADPFDPDADPEAAPDHDPQADPEVSRTEPAVPDGVGTPHTP